MINIGARSGSNVQILEPPLVAALQPIIDTISNSLRERRIAGDHNASMMIPVAAGQALVVSLVMGAERSTPQPKLPTRGLDARQLGRVIASIRERIGDPISVSMLSSAAGVSRSHFYPAFRKSTGRTPHEYIVQLRIEHAMKLMAGSEKSLSEIALAAGFSDQAHFSNYFRRTVGMTPGTWRRKQFTICTRAPQKRTVNNGARNV